MRRVFSLRGLAILSDFITVGLFAYAITAWTMNNILCNPYFRVALCSLLFSLLVFVVEPAFKKYNINQRGFKIVAYSVLITLFLIIILFLPKGRCTLTTSVNSAKDDLVKTTIPVVVHDTIVKHDTVIDRINPETVYVGKKLPKKDKRLVANSQKVDSGAAIQNNSPNSGNQAAGVTSFNQSGGITAGQVTIGPVARKLDDNLKIQLLTLLPDKEERVNITSPMNDNEAMQYANLITTFLRTQGYKKIHGTEHVMSFTPVFGQYFERDSSGVKITIGSMPIN